jgi:hypothetical protein
MIFSIKNVKEISTSILTSNFSFYYILWFIEALKNTYNLAPSKRTMMP